MSLVEQFIQFMKHTLAVKMVALPREYSHRHSNLSCEVASHKKSECLLNNFATNFWEELIIGQKFPTHFQEERITVRKFTTNFREERIIVRKIMRIETIDVAKLQQKINEILFQMK